MVNHPFGIIGGQLVDQIFTGIVWFVLVMIIATVLIGFIIYLRWRRKFDITVKIISERAGEAVSLIFDRAAIIYDKDGTKCFRLLKTKKELPVPAYNILQRSNKGDYLEIYRRGEDDFQYVRPKISKSLVYMPDGREVPITQIDLLMVNENAIDWNLRRKKINKGLFDNEVWYMKLLPHIPAIMGGIITLFILYVLFDSLPQILSSLADLTAELRDFKSADISQG